MEILTDQMKGKVFAFIFLILGEREVPMHGGIQIVFCQSARTSLPPHIGAHDPLPFPIYFPLTFAKNPLSILLNTTGCSMLAICAASGMMNSSDAAICS